MNLKAKHIALFLLVIVLSLMLEKAIPHSYIEHNGIVIPEWQSDNHSDEEAESENLHHSLYQLH